MRQIVIKGIEFPTAGEAIQHTNASGFGIAIYIGGKHLVVSEAETQRLEAAGLHFAYLHERDGRIVAVPTN